MHNNLNAQVREIIAGHFGIDPERATDAEQPCAVQQGAISMGVRPGRARPERHTNGGGR